MVVAAVVLLVELVVTVALAAVLVEMEQQVDLILVAVHKGGMEEILAHLVDIMVLAVAVEQHKKALMELVQVLHVKVVEEVDLV
jgi:hypothetical protein